MITLAIDAMGGDKGPAIAVYGVKTALENLPNLKVILFGDKDQLVPIIKKAQLDRSRIEIHHTPDFITHGMKPSVAFRKMKNSSMALAVAAVKEGKADAVVSAGNTGALVAFGLFTFRMLPGVGRPAIASLVPGINKGALMLDLGANSECSTKNLVEYALMGHIYAKVILELENPSIGLLNMGAEDLKGNSRVKEAFTILNQKEMGLNFKGFVEGNDITENAVDVVVTDGFTGNIALKAAEGVIKTMMEVAKSHANSSLLQRILFKIGMIFGAPSLLAVKKRMDPRRYNGAWLLGINGICVKSHGNTDEYGFYRAIKNTLVAVEKNLLDKIRYELELHQADIWIESDNSSS